MNSNNKGVDSRSFSSKLAERFAKSAFGVYHNNIIGFYTFSGLIILEQILMAFLLVISSLPGTQLLSYDSSDRLIDTSNLYLYLG